MLAFRFFLIILGALLIGSLNTNAAERCEGIFLAGPYQEIALAAALNKAKTADKMRGLSARDLDFLVESIFNKQEGRRYQLSEYWKTNTPDRTLNAIERQISEYITKEGLLSYFKQNNLLVDNSRLRTKFELLNRDPTFNILSGMWSAVAAFKGAPPILLPEGSFRIQPHDFNTLLLKGLNSAEGKEIASRYQLRLEVNRGYDLFSRYYTRVALAVLIYIVYEKTEKLLDKNKNGLSFEQVMQEIEKQFSADKKIQSKEDVLFETVIGKFKEKYSRPPDSREMNQICIKVYGPSGCP